MYGQKYADAERLYSKLLLRTTPPSADERNASHAAADSNQGQRLLILGRLGQLNALYLRDYARAIANYETLARENPAGDASLAALTAIADIYRYKLGDIQGAIDAYQRLVAEFPTRAEARRAQLNTVTSYAKLKDYDQARLEAEALITHHPNTSEAAQALFAMAEAYYGQKRYSEGIATYERILTNQPDPKLAALVSFELGNGYQNLGDSARALDYFYQALPAHPNPQLLQRKIARVRARLHHTTPAGTIMTASSSVGRRVKRKRPSTPTEALALPWGPWAAPQSLAKPKARRKIKEYRDETSARPSQRGDYRPR